MFRKTIIALAAAGLALGAAAPANAAKPSIPNVQIVYEYQTPTEPPEPGTVAVVNYTENDYWLCVKWVDGGINYQYSFFLDEYAEPGHERTGSFAVDPGSTVNLYRAELSSDGTAVSCTKDRWDTFRVPR